MTTRTYTVEGLTCQYCVNAVSGEVGQLPGVTTADRRGPVRAAVDQAGYRVTS
jgi:copper chaperone